MAKATNEDKNVEVSEIGQKLSSLNYVIVYRLLL